RMADHYHSGSEHGIIGRRIETIVASWFHRAKAYAVPARRGGVRAEGDGRMAAMKPRTGDGPLEVTKEGRGIVMRVTHNRARHLVLPNPAAQGSRAMETRTS